MLSRKTISTDEVFDKCKVIAVVGASKNPEKEAHQIPLYLKQNGYQIIPVNPTADLIFGQKAYPTLLQIPDEVALTIDVVDVFRPSDELPEIAEQVIELGRRIGKKYIFWAQLGLENEAAKKKLAEAGFPYVMNSCMMVEHRRIFRKT
ncbi:MAG: CoA-binding protein [Conexivisphaerales archaeon]